MSIENLFNQNSFNILCANLICDNMTCSNSVKESLVANVITSNIINNSGNLIVGNVSFNGKISSLTGFIDANLDNDISTSQNLYITNQTDLQGTLICNTDKLKINSNVIIGQFHSLSNSTNSICIGQGNEVPNTQDTISIGAFNTNTGWNSIAIGRNVQSAFGSTNIGRSITNTHDNCVCLNTKSGAHAITTGGQNRFYVKPLRQASNPAGHTYSNSLWYDPATGEICYNP